jgi:hypothetical protein
MLIAYFIDWLFLRIMFYVFIFFHHKIIINVVIFIILYKYRKGNTTFI